MTDGLFHCEDCDSVLEENDNADNVKYSQEVLARYAVIKSTLDELEEGKEIGTKFSFCRLREQCLPIISLLKQTDSLVIPARFVFWDTDFWSSIIWQHILTHFSMQLYHKDFSWHRRRWGQ